MLFFVPKLAHHGAIRLWRKVSNKLVSTYFQLLIQVEKDQFFINFGRLHQNKTHVIPQLQTLR